MTIYLRAETVVWGIVRNAQILEREIHILQRMISKVEGGTVDTLQGLLDVRIARFARLTSDGRDFVTACEDLAPTLGVAPESIIMALSHDEWLDYGPPRPKVETYGF